MTSSEKRMLLPILRKLANHEKLNHRAQSAAEQLYARLTRKSEKKTQGRLRRNSEKQSSRASHKQETAAIREEVFKRENGMCAFCTLPAMELHHLEGGSGRRALQRASNCIALCLSCHREYHISPEDFRTRVLAWCEHYGYPVPRRYRGPPKVVAAGPPQAAPSSEVNAAAAEPAKAGGAP